VSGSILFFRKIEEIDLENDMCSAVQLAARMEVDLFVCRIACALDPTHLS